MRKIAAKRPLKGTLSKTESELTLPSLLPAGLIVADAAGLGLHHEVAATLMPWRHTANTRTKGPTPSGVGPFR